MGDSYTNGKRNHAVPTAISCFRPVPPGFALGGRRRMKKIIITINKIIRERVREVDWY